MSACDTTRLHLLVAKLRQLPEDALNAGIGDNPGRYARAFGRLEGMIEGIAVDFVSALDALDRESSK